MCNLALEQPSTAASRSNSAGAARFELRQATAKAHAAVDEAYSTFDLAAPEGYQAFLRAQYACLAPLEAALTFAGAERLLPDWPSRRRAQLLEADLADLGAGAAAPPQLQGAPGLRLPAAIMGALYVLEGSRFGGTVLSRRVRPGMPVRFLAVGAEPGAWRALVAALDRHLTSDGALHVAVEAAHAVFTSFETAARMRREFALG